MRFRAAVFVVLAATFALAPQRPDPFDKRQKEVIDKLPDEPKLKGHFVTGARGEPAFATQDGQLLQLSNAHQLPGVLPGLPVELKAEKEDGRLKGVDWQPKIVAAWEGGVKARFPVSEFGDLHQAYADLKEASDKLKVRAQGVVPIRQLSQAYEHVAEQALTAYVHIPAEARTSDLAKALCQLREQARREGRKAIYGRLDNYRPEVYQQIYENSKSAVAIAVHQGAWVPWGSGVLIGDDVVLTCLHVVDGRKPEELAVWFDFKRDPSFTSQDTYPVTEILARGTPPRPGMKDLDFALLKIGPNAQGKAAAKYPPPTVAAHRLHRDDALYLIGFPNQNPRTVHDNTFVLFPYRATDREFTDLQMYVCAEIQDSPNRSADLEQFLKSYVLNAVTNDYEYYSTRWKSPTVSADCDTFHGNSGSPAYDRLGNKLVGLLMAGEEDAPGHRYTPGWRSHEAILPIEAVCQQIRAQLGATWTTKYGVKVAQ